MKTQAETKKSHMNFQHFIVKAGRTASLTRILFSLVMKSSTRKDQNNLRSWQMSTDVCPSHISKEPILES